MKVLMVTPAIGEIYGGPSKSVVELVSALGQQGLEIDLIATSANGSESLDVPLNTWISEKFYRIRYFPYWKIQDYKISFSITCWLFNYVSNYDIVHTNAIFSYVNLPAYWACRWHRVPYVIAPRGMLAPWALSYKSSKKRIYYNFLEKPALNSASTIQVLAHAEERGIELLGLKSPCVVIPNGIHRQDFEYLPTPEIFYRKFPELYNLTLILFLGRIDPKKGLDLLALAFAKVRSQFPQTHLIVAGPDNINFLPTVQNYFAQAGCLDAVTFTGMLTGKLKYSALSAAQVYVSPSYSEGFSMSVLEAMAAGLPCVITTGCNFPEAAATRSAHVVNIDAEEIANALIQCLKNPKAAKKMGDLARSFILKEYSWEQISWKTINLYKHLI